MDPDPFQTEVAQVALSAAGAHGFALGGGHALIAHGVVWRQTEDVDLFTDRDSGVVDASAAIEQALTDAGLTVTPEISELGNVFEGFEQDMREYEVSRGGHTTRLTLARFDRLNDPVSMDVGPVLHIEDVAGSKMAAMITRAEPRDYIDIAAAMRVVGRDKLLALAQRTDPSITAEEIAESVRRLDRLDDSVFQSLYGLNVLEVGQLRAAFADWPRS